MKHKSKSSGPCSGVCLLLSLVLTLFLCGVLVSMQSVPTHDPANANLKALYDYSSEHLKQWTTPAHIPFTNVEYTAPSWTPISITGLSGSDPNVELCKLDFKEYAKNPHLYAMFKDLVAKSQCSGANSRYARLSELKNEMRNKPTDWTYLQPTGFVFHESRVGSTLVANMLASDPLSMVFSESAPPSAVLLARGLSRERKIELFRDVLTLMGLTTMHQRMFFKFQSITNTVNDIALEAFPNTPWVFVYRQPVQTMMSHVGKGKAGGPCLRSKRSPPEEVKSAMAKFKQAGSVETDAAWCAAHLNMLCTKAIDAMEAYGEYKSTGTDRDGTQRGIVVDYAGLPGAIPRVMLPLFGVSDVSPAWISKMEESSQFYSKGGRKKSAEVFEGDSEEKDARANQEVKEAAAAILQPSYDTLSEMATSSIFGMKQPFLGEPLSPGARLDTEVLWEELSELPKFAGLGALRGQSQAPHIPAEGFSTLKSLSPEMDLLWKSFASNHSSKAFEPTVCPDYPDPDYPKEYPIMDLINNWNPDDTNIPPMHYDNICRFDYQKQYDVAERYREAEKPFIVYNVPAVDNLVKKWSNVDYINKLLQGKRYHSETSTSNHFMYFRGGKGKIVKSFNGTSVAWTPPTKSVKITFEDWLKVAVKGQNMDNNNLREHIYFRVTAQNKRAENGWLFDETEIFKPEKSFFIVEPKEQRGIHCRFGMRSIIAENHYDGSRNFVMEVGGLRRWILSHPKNCESMYLLQKGHPSGRHSEVDWSDPDFTVYPKFKNLRANEIIFKPGEVLYVPTSWFHYIVSLNVNYQCNTRSGKEDTYTMDLRKCGWS